MVLLGLQASHSLSGDGVHFRAERKKRFQLVPFSLCDTYGNAQALGHSTSRFPLVLALLLFAMEIPVSVSYAAISKSPESWDLSISLSF